MMKEAETCHEKRDPIIGIIGPGAVGCALASLIYPKFSGLGMVGRNGPAEFTFHVHSKSSAKHDFHLPCIHEFDLIFICVKAYQLPGLFTAHRSLWERAKPAAMVVLCNGMVDELIGEEGPPQVRMGLTTLAVKPLKPHHYELTNGDQALVQWGGHSKISRDEKVFLNKISHAGFQWREDIDVLRRRKWLFNSALNPVCGIYQLSANGLSLHYKDEVEALFLEAYALGEKIWGRWPQTCDDLLTQFWHLVQQTSGNRNSLVVDLQSGRPTEVDYLTGLYRLDPTGHYPHLEAMTARIHKIQNS